MNLDARWRVRAIADRKVLCLPAVFLIPLQSPSDTKTDGRGFFVRCRVPFSASIRTAQASCTQTKEGMQCDVFMVTAAKRCSTSGQGYFSGHKFTFSRSVFVTKLNVTL